MAINTVYERCLRIGECLNEQSTWTVEGSRRLQILELKKYEQRFYGLMLEQRVENAYLGPTQMNAQICSQR